ncbi:hypothetical protein VTO73DRAFT_7644 [Trametes versicolor]
MPSVQSSYSRLPSSPLRHDGFEPLDIEDEVMRDQVHDVGRRTTLLTEATCWKLLIASCVVSLVLSAANFSALSTYTTIRALNQSPPTTRTAASELKRPSVYLGLEDVIFEPSYCRNRGTFPKTFYTYDARAAQNAELERVHAPDDKTTLVFGGSVRAVAAVYVPDHGLENCTVNIRRVREQTQSELPSNEVEVEVFMRPGLDITAEDQPPIYLDTLAFALGKETSSRPFYCPSRSYIFLEWRCAAQDCRITMPLEGVTSLTASTDSLLQSGFRITQYEALHCILS